MKTSFTVTAIAWANVRDRFGMAERESGLMSTCSTWKIRGGICRSEWRKFNVKVACHSAFHLYNPGEAHQLVSPFSIMQQKNILYTTKPTDTHHMVYVASLLATFELTERLAILYEAPFIAYPDGKWMMAQCWLPLSANIWPTNCCRMLAMKSCESGCCNTEINKSVIRPLMNLYPRDDTDRKLQLGHFQHKIGMPHKRYIWLAQHLTSVHLQSDLDNNV